MKAAAKEGLIHSVLLIDDNEDDNYIHTRQLMKSGIVSNRQSISVAYNGVEALDFLNECSHSPESNQHKFPPSLIFVDINMPRMNGFEFLENLPQSQASDKLTDCVMIMLSSSTNPEEVKRANSYPQIYGFYSKPLSREDIEEIVRTHFS